ncbi:HIT domain-containing protein [Leucobacter sp. BZR 635]
MRACAQLGIGRLGGMAEETVFGKIISGEIPTEFLAETERVVAFPDINPQAPVHILVIPKSTEYADVTELAAGDPELLAEMVTVAKQLANEHANGEYRLIFNNGASAGQTVFHVHAHVIAHLEERSLLGF